MRLQIFSDFHFDARPPRPPRRAPGADLVVAAGDVCEGVVRGLQWLRLHMGNDVPMVFVAGNHEYFGRSMATENHDGQAEAGRLGITFLDNQVTEIDGVRFIGSTLWADFNLFGERARADSMRVADALMVDHRQISRAGDTPFLAADARLAHLAARSFLEGALSVPHAGPTVVVTHHAPHLRSLAAKFRKDPISAAFISDLSDIIEAYQPELWIHGHTHTSFDYRVGRTRIVCNPHGYGDENPHYDPELVVDV